MLLAVVRQVVLGGWASRLGKQRIGPKRLKIVQKGPEQHQKAQLAPKVQMDFKRPKLA